MRLFIAVNFSQDTKSRLAALRDKIHAGSKRGSFTIPENMHLTLVFLGECGGNKAAEIKAVMDTVCFDPFRLTIGSIGRFKRADGDIWWAGIAECKPLLELQRSLFDRLTEAGFPLENRKYSPHITLGRRVITNMPPQSINPFAERVSAIELMKSEQIHGKLTYTAIHAKGANSQ